MPPKFDILWNGTPDNGWAVVSLPEAVRDRLIGLMKTRPPPRGSTQLKMLPRRTRTSKVHVSKPLFELAPRIDGGTGVGSEIGGHDPRLPSSAEGHCAAGVSRDLPGRELPARRRSGAWKDDRGGSGAAGTVVSGRGGNGCFVVLGICHSTVAGGTDREVRLSTCHATTGKTFWSASGVSRSPALGISWRAFPVVLASFARGLRRQTWREEFPCGGTWDAVLVDEAHHARFLRPKLNDTPNALLALPFGQ